MPVAGSAGWTNRADQRRHSPRRRGNDDVEDKKWEAPPAPPTRSAPGSDAGEQAHHDTAIVHEAEPVVALAVAIDVRPRLALGIEVARHIVTIGREVGRALVIGQSCFDHFVLIDRDRVGDVLRLAEQVVDTLSDTVVTSSGTPSPSLSTPFTVAFAWLTALEIPFVRQVETVGGGRFQERVPAADADVAGGDVLRPRSMPNRGSSRSVICGKLMRLVVSTYSCDAPSTARSYTANSLKPVTLAFTALSYLPSLPFD